MIVERIAANKVALFEQIYNLMKKDILLMIFNDHKPIKHNHTLIRLDKNDFTGLMILIVRGLDQALDKLWWESLKKGKVLDPLS